MRMICARLLRGSVQRWGRRKSAMDMLLLDGLHTLTLVHIASQQAQILLSDGSAPVTTDEPFPSASAFLQPVANSPWNVDSQRFVVTTRGRLLWQSQHLSPGNHAQSDGGCFNLTQYNSWYCMSTKPWSWSGIWVRTTSCRRQRSVDEPMHRQKAIY